LRRAARLKGAGAVTFDPSAGNSPATQFNVAQLLKGPVGDSRRYHLDAPLLPLGEEREARAIEGDVKMTRLSRGLLVTGAARATVELTCVRCLEEFSQPVEFELEEEFRPSLDMASGNAIAYRGDDADADYFLIDENHVLDLSEALRQAVWLAAPMMPRCREDCPGIEVADEDVEVVSATAESAARADARLAILGSLLGEDDDEDASAAPATESSRRRSGRGKSGSL
jgi:uncharacterized protein